MQDYKDFAKKNDIKLLDKGECQFCGANIDGGIAECVDMFNNSLSNVIDFYNSINHIYKILSVDAHTLQHPEIHGRWNNHLHLTRLHLIYKYKVKWSHHSTIKLSKHLNKYKQFYKNEIILPPKPFQRGLITINQVINEPKDEEDFKEMIEKWAFGVYDSWKHHHKTIEKIAVMFEK